MNKPGQARGFTMLELLVVVAIILAVTGVAVPSVTRAMRLYRLNSTTTDVANLLQQARYEAIRLNTTVNCLARPTGNTWQVWVDLPPANRAPDPTEPTILLPADVQFLPPGAGGMPSPASMGFPAAQTPTGVITFNSRGTVNFAGGPVVYVVYLGFPQQPQYGFKAVTLTPMGKTKVWSATRGATWHSP